MIIKLFLLCMEHDDQIPMLMVVNIHQLGSVSAKSGCGGECICGGNPDTPLGDMCRPGGTIIGVFACL
jgi:hypothetical protein